MVDNTLDSVVTTDYVRKFQAITVALQKFNNTHNKHTHVITAAKNVTLLNIYIIFPNGHLNTKSSTLL